MIGTPHDTPMSRYTPIATSNSAEKHYNTYSAHTHQYYYKNKTRNLTYQKHKHKSTYMIRTHHRTIISTLWPTFLKHFSIATPYSTVKNKARYNYAARTQNTTTNSKPKSYNPTA